MTDLDGDGRLDLAVADLGSGNLAAFFQGSAGAFPPAPELRLGGLQRPLGIAAGDIDGDGRADLAAADALGNRLGIFLQGGSRNFPGVPDLLLGRHHSAVPLGAAAADLDGDGLLDLAVSRNGSPAGLPDTLLVFFQKGPGIFSPDPDVTLLMPSGDSPDTILAADLDGDGAVDLVTTRAFAKTLGVFFQGPQGHFLERMDLEPLSEPQSIRAADLDGDGDLDIVVEANPPSLIIFIQVGDRTFRRSDPALALPGQGFATDLTVADLNEDGQLDLAAVTGGSPYFIRIFFQKPQGGFSLNPDLSIGSRQDDINLDTDIVALDLDGDGHQDLMTRASASGLYLFFQMEGKSFPDAPDLWLSDQQSGVMLDSSTQTASDLDGDGRPDLVSGNNGSGTLTVLYQRVRRAFGSTQAVSPGIIPDQILDGSGGPLALRAVDLDGDGDPDLIVACARSLALNVYFGNH